MRPDDDQLRVDPSRLRQDGVGNGALDHQGGHFAAPASQPLGAVLEPLPLLAVLGGDLVADPRGAGVVPHEARIGFGDVQQPDPAVRCRGGVAVVREA